MGLPDVVLICFLILGLVLLVCFEAVRIYNEGGLKLFFWPRLNHGYEVGPVARLAIAPWVLLAFLCGGNGVVIALFGHDMFGNPFSSYLPWFAGMLVPFLMIHLIDHHRSLVAATIGLLLLAAGSAYMIWSLAAWAWVPLVAILLLWSLNGVRATYAERSMS
ncbi:hypothetical protein [Benzoatithermus flavus]|uniref:Uncharacterized protein n=1 Tax=Benzoatithermus flavus TaxID=3108223 RepID=A0ABU8XSG3_9PROT